MPAAAYIHVTPGVHRLITQARDLFFQAQALGEIYALEFWNPDCEFLDKIPDSVNAEDTERVFGGGYLIINSPWEEGSYKVRRTCSDTIKVTDDSVQWTAADKYGSEIYETPPITFIDLGLPRDLPPVYGAEKCSSCDFLGRFAFPGPLANGKFKAVMADLYACKDTDVIVRYGRKRSQYASARIETVAATFDHMREHPGTHTPGLLEAFVRWRAPRS